MLQMLRSDLSVFRLARPECRKVKEYCSLSPGFAGERVGVRRLLESRSHFDISPLSSGFLSKQVRRDPMYGPSP